MLIQVAFTGRASGLSFFFYLFATLLQFAEFLLIINSCY